jgi:hypothetical protein
MTTVPPHTTATESVLATFEHNGYDDSEFFAIVWDGQAVCVKLTGATWGQFTCIRRPDATDDDHQAARAWIAGPLYARMRTAAEQQAAQVTTDAQVGSTTTRGKNVAITGTVKRITEDGYRTTRHHTFYRALVVLPNGEQRWMNTDRLGAPTLPPSTPTPCETWPNTPPTCATGAPSYTSPGCATVHSPRTSARHGGRTQTQAGRDGNPSRPPSPRQRKANRCTTSPSTCVSPPTSAPASSAAPRPAPTTRPTSAPNCC